MAGVGSVVNTIGKGVGMAAGAVTGAGSRLIRGTGGLIREATTGAVSGLKTAHGWASGSAAKAAKESAEVAAKTTKEATERVAMKTRRLERATNALDPNFVGPMPVGVADDANKLKILKDAKDPNFIGPRPSDDVLRKVSQEVQATMDPNFIGPMTTAQEMVESGAGFWSGLGEMIQAHPYIAAGIAGGVGVAGGLLLGDDDDD